MTALPSQVTIRQYIADGVEDTYTYPFYITSKFDLEVYVQAPNATAIPTTDIQEVDVDYTVTGVGVIAGGTIVFEAGHIPAVGYIVTIARNVQASLDVDFANVSNFNGTTLDNALLKNMIVAAQNQTYATQRNLSYVVNDYLGDTDEEVYANTQLQRLQEGYIWQGAAGGGVAAVELTENDNWSTLRSELENDAAVTNGAAIIGYYDTVNALPTNVADFLNDLVPFIQDQIETQLWQPGDLKDHASATVPSGWLACDGSAVSRTTYAALFAVIGTTWGVGDGSTTFNVPNFQRRVTVGSGGSGTGTLGNAVGNTGGAESVALSIAEMPAHDHTGSTAPTAGGVSGGAPVCILWHNTAPTATSPITVASQGSGTAHNNMQPSAVVLKLIKT